ncbi:MULTISPECIES: ion transporter [Sulfurimonas]|uniref:ion transporter n=1 Tax=Sulfurimonas TaxID=202746 RepID=UPI00126517F7|nr:ion transporter [Sulfurimonas indica]
MHKKVYNLVESPKFKNFILLVILLNGITMGIETYPSIHEHIKDELYLFDTVVITIFIIEIGLRIYAHRVSFFKDGWSLFDLSIVLVSMFPANSVFEIFRILRIFRLLRVITIVPQMRKIVMALASVIPGMASIAGLMSILFYIAAVMSTQLFGDRFPDWFGSLGSSLYTLFQIMTLESWSMGIARPIMEIYPHAWLFFVPFIFIVTFIMINLIVAVVVDAMNHLSENQEAQVEVVAKDEIKELHNEIKELKELLLESKK